MLPKSCNDTKTSVSEGTFWCDENMSKIISVASQMPVSLPIKPKSWNAVDLPITLMPQATTTKQNISRREWWRHTLVSKSSESKCHQRNTLTAGRTDTSLFQIKESFLSEWLYLGKMAAKVELFWQDSSTLDRHIVSDSNPKGKVLSQNGSTLVEWLQGAFFKSKCPLQKLDCFVW